MLEQKSNVGIFTGLLTYVMWGFIPLFFKLLAEVLPLEILAQRIIWAAVFMVLAVVFTRKWPAFSVILKGVFQSPKQFVMMLVVALLISTNWFVFIWAINHNHILQTSLGYYINPIVSIVLGVIFLKERLSRVQVVAVILAFAGVMVMTLSFGAVPYLSLMLAFSFGFYGLLKKKMDIPAIEGLAIETVFVAPLALMLWGYYIFSYQSFVTHNATVTTWLLVICSGLVTAVPLLLFAFTARKVTLSMLGFMQYIAPTISLLLGVFIYNEAFTRTHAFSFALIWLGLLIYSMATIRQYRKK